MQTIRSRVTAMVANNSDSESNVCRSVILDRIHKQAYKMPVMLTGAVRITALPNWNTFARKLHLYIGTGFRQLRKNFKCNRSIGRMQEPFPNHFDCQQTCPSAMSFEHFAQPARFSRVTKNSLNKTSKTAMAVTGNWKLPTLDWIFKLQLLALACLFAPVCVTVSVLEREWMCAYHTKAHVLGGALNWFSVEIKAPM